MPTDGDRDDARQGERGHDRTPATVAPHTILVFDRGYVDVTSKVYFVKRLKDRTVYEVVER